MPLMPMPPMPTKWIGPMSRGNFMEPPLLSSEPCRSCPRNPDAGRLSTGGRTVLRLPGLDPPDLHRQVGEPVGGVEDALAARRGGHGGELLGLGGEARDLGGEA